MPYSRPVERFWTTDDMTSATTTRLGRLLVWARMVFQFFENSKSVTNIQPQPPRFSRERLVSQALALCNSCCGYHKRCPSSRDPHRRDTFNVGSRDAWRFLIDRDSSRRVQNDDEVEDHRKASATDWLRENPGHGTDPGIGRYWSMGHSARGMRTSI